MSAWRVDEDPRKFAVQVDRIRFTCSGNVGHGPLEVVYDSADETATGQGAAALAGLFDAIVGSVAQVKMEPHGSLIGLELPEEVKGRFSEVAAAELAGFFGEMVAPLGLSRRLLLVGVPLPDKEVSSGQMWRQTYTLNGGQGPLNSISGVASYGYFVVDGDEDKPIARIRMQAEEALNVRGVDLADVPKIHVCSSASPQEKSTQTSVGRCLAGGFEKQVRPRKPRSHTMNLVVGATGYLGTAICRLLAASGKPVRALVRRAAEAAKVERLQEMGAALAWGDLKDRASLDAACAGVTAILTTATTTLSRQPSDSIEATDRDGQLNLVESAKAAGVRRFIYTSFSGQIDNGEDPCPLTLAKRAVEQSLRASGIAFTILRPSFFMEVWLSPPLGFDFPNARATVYGTGHNKISWISLDDVAAFTVTCLENPAARNATIELGGPQALSPLEVVAVFEEVGGRPFAVTHVPADALRAQKAEATDSLQKSFAALMLAYAAGDAIDMGETLKTFPVRLSSVPEYAMRVLEC